MKIVLAQGNPGAPYKNTRHNIGFETIDYYAHINGAKWQEKTKFKAFIAEFLLNGEKIILVKPTTFYNLTGQSARLLVDFYKINPEKDFMVIHDDLALEFGKLRIRHRGSDGGNNGIKSLNNHLGVHYYRLRIGTANNLLNENPDADFVLSKFNLKEQATIKEKILPLSSEIITEFCEESIEDTSFTVD